jgi:cyclin-dependent kinase
MNDYTLAVDIWSIGCIFAEMVMMGHVLIPGTSEVEQLFKTFHLLGTPSPSLWARAVTLPDFKVCFPKWPVRQPFKELLEPVFEH